MNEADKIILTSADFWYVVFTLLMLFCFVVYPVMERNGLTLKAVVSPLLLLFRALFWIVRLLAGTVAVSMQTEQLQEEEKEDALPPPAFSLDTLSDTLTLPQWLHIVNGLPDMYPHLLVVAPTGAGKTTLVQVVAGVRGDSVLVLSPKVNTDNWQGANVISLDNDGSYSLLEQAMEEIEQEKRRRVVALRNGEELKPVTIILDETPDLVDFVKPTGTVIKTLASLGREIKMRLIIISTSERVRALGIEGRGDTRDNFVRVSLNKRREATLIIEGKSYSLSTEKVVDLSRTISMVSFSTSTDNAAKNADNPLSVLVPPSGTSTGTEYDGDCNEELSQQQIDALIKASLAEGISANKLFGFIGGNRSNFLKRFKQLKDAS